MRVILLKDIENIGKKYDIKEVKDGYARNFLIPNGLAKPVTKKILEWLEVQKEIQEKKVEQELKKTQELASSIDGLEVNIPVAVGNNDELFESINNQKISEKLKEMGYHVKKNQIDLAKPIKELGEFPIKIKFEHNLEVEIKIIISKTEDKAKK